MLGIGVHVGGSAIKAAEVETDSGKLRTDPVQVPSPEGFAREDVFDTIARVVEELDAPSGVPLGVGFPSVVRRDVARTDPSSLQYAGWKGTDLAAEIAERTQRPTSVANDGDMAGWAEVTFGAARGRRGVVIVLSFGAGIGSALFLDGALVPNVELGRIYLPGEEHVVEYQAAARIRDEEDLSWKRYAKRLNRYLHHLDRVFSPDLIVIGGAIAEDAGRWISRLDVDARLAPAALGSDAGVIGAALLGVHSGP